MAGLLSGVGPPWPKAHCFTTVRYEATLALGEHFGKFPGHREFAGITDKFDVPILVKHIAAGGVRG